MNILVTGKPRSGKSTLVEKIVEEVDSKRGFYTREMRENGERTGFQIVAYDGGKYLLASTKITREHKVGRYNVTLSSLDAEVVKMQKFKNGEFLYLDEIGQMQLYSGRFKKLIKNCVRAPNNFLGTLTEVYEDEITKWLKARKDVQIIRIDENNRDSQYKKIKEMLNI